MTVDVLSAWRAHNRANLVLIRQLPPRLWAAAVPGLPRKTVRSIAAHLHNARVRWIKTLGAEHGITAPPRVNQGTVTRAQLGAALRQSGKGIEALLRLGLASGGTVPPSRRYVWRNLSLEVPHVLTYFVAHEAHHRGQLVMLARQLGQPLPASLHAGLWKW